jgi:glyoxylase-like metal-dependent hydrolase (beta-lactamase superfamily II)
MAVRIDTVRVGITNTYLLRDRGAVLIDPGMPGKSATLLRKLHERIGEVPHIDLILVTHAHFDHIGSASRVRKATGAPLAVHSGDAGWLRRGEAVWPLGVTRWGKFVRTVFGPVTLALARVEPVEPDLVLDDAGLDLEAYGVSGRVVATPGHSPGSVSVLLPTGEAFVGDLAMNGPPLCLKPCFGIFADRPEQVPGSWQRLLELGARTVYPAHGRPFPASALPPLAA